MPSQEDYLDSLLKDLGAPGGETDKQDIPVDMDDLSMFAKDVAVDMDDLSAQAAAGDMGQFDMGDMGQFDVGDIDALLQTAQDINVEKGAKKQTAPQESGDDMFGPADAAGDADWQEIQELLQKADNNEPIAEEAEGATEEKMRDASGAADDFGFFGTYESEEGMAEAEPADDKKAETDFPVQNTDKEAMKQEKRARKEARKAERKAKKEAKKEAKGQKEQSKEKVETVVPQGMEDFESLLEPSEAFSGALFDESSPEDLLDIPKLDTLSALETIGNEQKNPPKKSFWEKVLDFFTEEDEEESQSQDEIKLSEENKGILKEMDKEKSKKAKKANKKKKGAGKQTEDEEELSEEQAADKKKAKKEKREKKKAGREQEADSDTLQETGKKLSWQRVLPIVLICISLGAAVIILSYLSAGFAGKREARKAYYSEDYQTCYQNLFGKELNESEQVMFHKSESILKIRLWLREYQLFAEDGLEAEALDILIQSVEDYPALLEFAGQWNASEDVAEEYGRLLSILSEKYGLTQEQAKEIAAISEDVEYTKTVTSIAEGMNYTEYQKDLEEQEKQAEMEKERPDRLPEEESLPDVTFIDNNRP